MDLLKDAGLWLPALGHWTRLQIINEVSWDKETELNHIDALEASWLEKNTLEKANLTKEQLRHKLHIQRPDVEREDFGRGNAGVVGLKLAF